MALGEQEDSVALTASQGPSLGLSQGIIGVRLFALSALAEGGKSGPTPRGRQDGAAAKCGNQIAANSL
jgi:hypothetical protein